MLAVRLPVSGHICQSCFKHLEADFGCKLVWFKPRSHLCVWVDVVSEIPQPVTKFLYIRLEQANVARHINEF